jgi:NADH:ubiquinone oxidoreductase subunit 4 (subunit M)
MIPFHIWLPLAHTEGNTSASIILAALILKIGTYGIMRFLLPFFPFAFKFLFPFLTTLALIGIIYSCISAFSLIDLKQVIAYSSIAHMNVGILGLISNSIYGIVGNYIYGISHGLISTGCFILVGILYERFHTRTIKYYRGLAIVFPLFSLFYLLFSLANISFPGTSGFLSEILIYLSLIIKTSNIYIGLFIASVSFLLPIYFMKTLHQIIYGRISNYIPIIPMDLTIKETSI